MRETQLVASHRKKWLKKHPNGYYHKIADGLGAGGQKPYDAYCWSKHSGQLKVWAIEFKIHKTHNAFPLSKIQPHQIRELVLAEKAGAIATVFIGVRFLMDVDTQKRLGLRLRQIHVDVELPIQHIVSLIKEGKKSIKILPYLLKEINGE